MEGAKKPAVNKPKQGGKKDKKDVTPAKTSGDKVASGKPQPKKSRAAPAKTAAKKAPSSKKGEKKASAKASVPKEPKVVTPAVPLFAVRNYNAQPVASDVGVINYNALSSSLSVEDKRIGDALIAAGQAHLFAAWTSELAVAQKSLRAAFFAQAKEMDVSYPGGLVTYLTRSKDLLAKAKSNANPYEGYRVAEPTDYVRLERADDFTKWEARGLQEVAASAYVLVAGGLGERLGYDGIKVALPAEITSGKCYLQLYVEHILALQARVQVTSGQPVVLPLGIMTSDDTDKLTRKLLARHNYFGMQRDQITIFKQGKVPALLDNDAHIAVDEKNPFIIDSKPHGHGDVHTLLYQTKLVEKWVRQMGKKWVVFFQDTNGLVFRAIPAALGVSGEKKLAVNSITVPRVQGDAVGAICRLTREGKVENKSAEDLPATLTINVEYNQLEGLLGKGVKEPIVKGSDNISVYPGNINVLIFDAPAYLSVLEAKKGIIAEFVNPKYVAGSDNNVFTKPTRLECMMQDYPKLLTADARVSFTQFDRWTSFSAVKNTIPEAKKKQESKNAPECAASGEADMYLWSRTILEGAKVQLGALGTKTYHGVTVPDGARVVLSPSVGVTQAEVAGKFPGAAAVDISARSTLMAEGSGIVFESLKLDGSLIIRAVEGARVTVRSLTVANKGWTFEELKDLSRDKNGIRGYQGAKDGEAEVYFFATAGTYILSDDTKLKCREDTKSANFDRMRRRKNVAAALATLRQAEKELEIARGRVAVAEAAVLSAKEDPLPARKARKERKEHTPRVASASSTSSTSTTGPADGETSSSAKPAKVVATIAPRDKTTTAAATTSAAPATAATATATPASPTSPSKSGNGAVKGSPKVSSPTSPSKGGKGK